MSRLAWTDPAPLEVERPRLPWWTMLPCKLLLVISPIIGLVTVVMVGVFLARRGWCYPLFLIGPAILAGLGITYSWWASVWLLACLGVGCGVWTWAHPGSFDRTVVRQIRSEWRRARIYAWQWKRVMLFSELTKRTGQGLRQVHYPTSAGSAPTVGATECPSGCCMANALQPMPRWPMS